MLTCLSKSELRTRLGAVPRVRLAQFPTPLVHCSRLSEALGGPRIYLKRDDMTGLGLGGNKVRQLEFVIADVIAKHADTIVVLDVMNSNWCRQIAAAAATVDLKVHFLLMCPAHEERYRSNLLIDMLMGAEITIVRCDDIQMLVPQLVAIADRLAADGRRPYIITPFEPEVLSLSALGYVNAALEIEDQLAAQDLSFHRIYVAGISATPAGLLVALGARGFEASIVSVSPIRGDRDRKTEIKKIAAAAASRIGIECPLKEQALIVAENYSGTHYTEVTPAAFESLKLLGETEGILLDPIYTGRAMAALIDHIRRGYIEDNELIVFVHTGGLPLLFDFVDELLASPTKR